MRASKLLPFALATAACASQPEADIRPQVPDRPTVERPEGTEPDGLAEVRETLAAQRAETREREQAVLVAPNALDTHPVKPWYEDAANTALDVVDVLSTVWFPRWLW